MSNGHFKIVHLNISYSIIKTLFCNFSMFSLKSTECILICKICPVFMLHTKHQLRYCTFVCNVKGVTLSHFIYLILSYSLIIFLVKYHTDYENIKIMDHILWIRLFYYLAKCLQLVYCHLKLFSISFIYHGDCHIFCVNTNPRNLFFILSKLLIRFYTICLTSYFPLFNLNCQSIFFAKSTSISTFLTYRR